MFNPAMRAAERMHTHEHTNKTCMHTCARPPPPPHTHTHLLALVDAVGPKHRPAAATLLQLAAWRRWSCGFLPGLPPAVSAHHCHTSASAAAPVPAADGVPVAAPLMTACGASQRHREWRWGKRGRQDPHDMVCCWGWGWGTAWRPPAGTGRSSPEPVSMRDWGGHSPLRTTKTGKHSKLNCWG